MTEPGSALLEKAEALLEARDVGGALKIFDEAENAGADADRCSGGRWMAKMLAGNFKGAWKESDAIRRRGAPDPNRYWMGEEFCGKRVMLRCLHGFGDAVQMLRYAPKLRERAAKLIVEVAPDFVELAGCFNGVDEVITWGEQAPLHSPAWDVQMEIVELPYVFRTQMDELPVARCYVKTPPLSEKDARRFNDGAMHVGLVWACGAWKPSRSVPLAMLRPLLDTPGCVFWNLQGGEAAEEAARSTPVRNFHSEVCCRGSMVRLAQLIAKMDLVITPDTLAAHLAGALGTRTWVMLKRAADWRWMLERDDSPWYPSLRLFRQQMDGDWQGVIDTIQAELASLAASHREALTAGGAP